VRFILLIFGEYLSSPPVFGEFVLLIFGEYLSSPPVFDGVRIAPKMSNTNLTETRERTKILAKDEQYEPHRKPGEN
jgi:hypothetical protein